MNIFHSYRLCIKHAHRKEKKAEAADIQKRSSNGRRRLFSKSKSFEASFHSPEIFISFQSKFPVRGETEFNSDLVVVDGVGVGVGVVFVVVVAVVNVVVVFNVVVVDVVAAQLIF